jgi:hypothetical protein
MQDTAIQAGSPTPRRTAPSSTPAPAIKKQVRGLPYKTLEFCASLRVTVVLFVLAFALVFYGTWAQVDAGTWTVVNQYFRWFYVYIPLKILVFRAIDIPENYGIPFPGGWTLGVLLLVNLLAAHAIRFKLSWKRSGIMILHTGLIVMMLGEFFTGVFAIEGRMTIVEGYASNFVERDRHYELAIVDRSEPKVDDEYRVPGSFLKDGNLVQHAELPFDIEVVRYMTNSTIRRLKDKESNSATVGVGQHRIAVARGEAAGVDPNQSGEFPSAYVTLKRKKTGESLGTYLLSTWFAFLNCQPDTVTEDGKKYQISLRPERSYRDYTIQLNKFQHKKFVGTEVAKDFRSFVRLMEPAKEENRQVEIYMNHPLYYRGETFYQASLPFLFTGTVLQVVHNWGWWLPYLSCALVAGGMLIHFGIMLFNFLGVQGILPGFGAVRTKKTKAVA